MQRFYAGVLLSVLPAAVASAAAAAGPPPGEDARMAPLVEAARERKLGEDRRWRLLLHVPARGGESEADAPSFFLSPRGKQDPSAELEATLAALFAEPGGAPDAHARCRFPARYRFLAEHLPLEAAGPPAPDCAAYEKWRATVAAGSATLVFASAQVEVPASMFGHTFLRLDRRGAAPGSTLLSTIVNYAAVPDSANPLVYTVKGLSGGFPGRFAAMPYFVKVAEYTNHESRELWEYPLSLSDDAMDWLQRHLWELESTHFDYYFFSENCSYHLLSLLELADPSRPLRGRFGAWTIPVDTVREARKAGLAGEPVLRRSHLSLLRARRDLLGSEERALAASLADARHEPEWASLSALPAERQAIVLDTSFDYLKYHYGFGRAPAEDVARRERRLLLERSTLRVPPIVPPPPPRPSPDSGHLSGRGGIAVRISGDPGAPRVVEELSWRPALHDLLDRPEGYSDGTQLEMFSFRLRIDPAHAGDTRRGADTVSVERIDLVRVDTLRPWEPWVRGPSWRFALGGGRVTDAACDGWRCTQVDMEGAFGAAVGSPARVLYLRAGVIPAAGGPIAPAWRITGAAGGGVLAQLTPGWRLHGEAVLRKDVWGGTPKPSDRAPYPVWSLGQALDLDRSAQLRLTLSGARDRREAVLGAVTYF